MKCVRFMIKNKNQSVHYIKCKCYNYHFIVNFKVYHMIYYCQRNKQLTKNELLSHK